MKKHDTQDVSKIIQQAGSKHQKSILAKRIAWVIALMLLSPLSAKEDTQVVVNHSVSETHITRDIFQPFGMPVVTAFHAMRENLFLNTKDKEATGLEAIGNFFLIPSRYLFAGKNIQPFDPALSPPALTPSFHYNRLHWFKTTLALMILPVSEILGSTFKGLSYLSPKVRRHHRLVRSSLKAPLIQSHLENYKKQGICEFHSEEFIPCLDHKRPSYLTKKQQVEIQALKEIIALFDAHKIVYWIDCGTALGSYRYGGIIPWDWDIDLAILLPDHENVKRILSNLDPDKYQIQDWSSYSNPKTFLKLYVKETKNFIDIFHYEIREDEQKLAYFFTFKDSPFPDSWKKDELKCMTPVKYEDVFPLKKAHFDGLTVWAPNDTVTYLQSKFGENLEPSNIWDEKSQVYKKIMDHPYWKE